MRFFLGLSINILFLLSLSFNTQAAEQESSALSQDTTDSTTKKTAYIADDLFIFMHSGAGKQYRLLGSINSGSQITLISNVKNNYQKIIDDKGRTGWVESKFIQSSPSLRTIIAELNAQLASKDEQNDLLDTELLTIKDQINVLIKDKTDLALQLTNTNKQLASAQAKLQQQNSAIKKQWFYNGAVVLGIGLILGLLLPRLAVRRRSSMDSWQ
ncbi:MAG: hypothetical protein COB35_02175 [Gammaproteobacteria bacterium]|nr:MAG: hypothetical protein COB35_02175 [Gammaproteobacteria bacterium]